MRKLLRVAILLLLAASYVTLGIAAPHTATTFLVWLPYAACASALAIINLCGDHERRPR